MKAILKFILCSLIFLASTSAFATQYVDASDASGQRLNISDKELTRIAIDGGYITNVKAERMGYKVCVKIAINYIEING